GVVEPGRLQGPERIVSREQLVAAITAERDGHPLTRQPGNKRRRQKGAVTHHLVEFLCRLECPVEVAFRREDFLMVTRLRGFGAEPGKLPFVERFFFKSNAEGFDGRMMPRRKGRDGR